MEPSASVQPPRAEERTAELVRLYEARAYLIYNLALRITCEADSAIAAAEAAFVGQAAHGASEATLVPALVVSALGHAKRKPKPSGVGDAELELLRVAAALPPTERAALALSVLADLGAQEVSALLRIDQAAGAELLERAQESFAIGAGVPPDEFARRYGDWGWADPPAELWERVYPGFRRALERPPVAQAPAGAPTQAMPAVGSVAPPRSTRRRWPWLLAAVAALALLAAGVMAYTQRGGGTHAGPTVADLADNGANPALPPSQPADGGTPPPASVTGDTDNPVAAVQAKPHRPLTAKELDALRLKELQALRTYEKRQADKRLTDSQRNYAARKVSALRDLARRRLAIRRRERALAERERALARQEQAAAKRREQAAQDEPSQRPPTKTPTAPPQTAPPEDGGDSTEDQAQAECVVDQDTGEYICPQ